MLNIYNGTLGVTTNVDKIIHEINKVLIKVDNTFNYEVKENKYKVILITGKYEEEKHIPNFNHPLVFKDNKNNDSIAIDLRLYMKSNLEDMINVTDKFSDRYNGELQLHRLILNKLFLEDNTSFMSSINTNILNTFTSILSSLISTIIYDKSILNITTLVSALHYITMDNSNLNFNMCLDALPVNISKKLYNGDLKEYKNKIEILIESNKFKLPSEYITTLLDNIKVLSDNNKVQGITEDMLISILSRGFYSLNNKEMSVAIIEHKPTLLAIIYSVITEGVNSKTIFRKIIEGRKSIIKPKDISKTIKQVIEDNILKY